MPDFRVAGTSDKNSQLRRAMSIRKKFAPIPVEALAFHPQALALPAAGFGMLMRICIHFWQTECRPLPTGANELFCIARAHRPTWRRYKASILKILADITPELERAWRSRQKRLHNLLRMAQRSASVRASYARKKETQTSTLGGPENSRLIRTPFAPRRTEANRARDLGASAPRPAPRGGFTDNLK